MEKDMQKREAFPFGVRACSTLNMPSELSASSSSTQPCMHDVLRTPTPSSAAKPAASAPCTSLSGVAQPIVSTLSGMIQEVNNVAPMLQGNASKTAQMLLDDIPILQKWQCAKNPSHEVRDAMMKLGPRWQVQRYEQRKKRAPVEVKIWKRACLRMAMHC